MNRRFFFGTLGAASVGLNVAPRSATAAARGHAERLAKLGIELPPAPAAKAVYAPYRVSGNQVFVAGQVPPVDLATPTVGKLGRDLTTEQGYIAAHHTGLRVLAQLQAACGGDLDRVVQCLQIRGFVNCADDFTEQSLVVNGVSELFRDVFGDAGLAARAALGTNSLPGNMAVEVESIFEIDV